MRRKYDDEVIRDAMRRDYYSSTRRSPNPRQSKIDVWAHRVGAIRQSRCTTSGFLHCCDRFYAQIDRDIREWDRQKLVELGVKWAVREWKRERRLERERRRLIIADLERKGLI